MYNQVKSNLSDVFIYYSGHGAPGISDHKGYFVPVECDPKYVNLQGYQLDLFYRNISKIPAKSVTIVLDACFSGVDLVDNISPIVVKIDNPLLKTDNSIVLTSSSSDEVSTWLDQTKHGLFTYFFLKAIHGKNADLNKDNKLTWEETYSYISDKTNGIPYWSRALNNQDQNPTIFCQQKDRVFIQY